MANIGIIGAGINGTFISWELSKIGHNVDIYDSGKAMQQTSSSSSKLLHGGIRYLEQGHLSLVRESLLDRHWWLRNASSFCKPIEICMPVYKSSPRSLIKLYFGAVMYNFLSGRYSLGPTRYNRASDTKSLFNEINSESLLGSVTFYDAQMNEEQLGKWVLDNAIKSGVSLYEETEVKGFNSQAELTLNEGGLKKYDYIINAAGPWAFDLNKSNNIKTNYYLRLIKGSHIILNTEINNSYLFQEPSGKRIVFIMPYLGKTLVGTTEVEQDLNSPIYCSNEEKKYLLNIYNNNFRLSASKLNIIKEFSGLRPIVYKKNSSLYKHFSLASREAEIEKFEKVYTVYGGKWTSAPSLSQKLIKKFEGKKF